MQQPLVTVIIPVKNGLPYFRRVLDMLQKQELDAPFEVIVIDSGSSDGSKEAVPADDPRFRVVHVAPSSFGHGRTRNLGVELSRGEYCAFLTHDAAPANEFWLRELLRPLREDESVAGVYGRHIAYENATPFTHWELKNHFDGLAAWPKVRISDAREYVRNEGLRQVYHFYSDNSSCMRKSVWRDIPYPDVDFAEDQLWAKRVVEAGYAKAYSHDSIVYHSHDYSPWERLRRSFDEARAFNELFGYKLGPTRRNAIRQAWRITGHDLMLAWQHGWIWTAPAATLMRPLDNLARQVGYYLGTRRPRFTQRYEQALSRDRTLQAQ